MQATLKKKSPGVPKHTSGNNMSVADAKAHFSSVIAGVQKQRTSVTILKRGVPVAEIVPIQDQKPSSGFGWMRGSVHELGDIVDPIGIDWTLKDE